jgi:hypothetical protein
MILFFLKKIYACGSAHFGSKDRHSELKTPKGMKLKCQEAQHDGVTAVVQYDK